MSIRIKNILALFFLFSFPMSSFSHWEPADKMRYGKAYIDTLVVTTNPSTPPTGGLLSVENWLYDRLIVEDDLREVVRHGHQVTTYTIGMDQTGTYRHHEYCEIVFKLEIRNYDSLGTVMDLGPITINYVDSFKIKYDPASGFVDFPAMTKTFLNRGLRTECYVLGIEYWAYNGGGVLTPTTVTQTSNYGVLPQNLFLEIKNEVNTYFYFEHIDFETRANLNSPTIYAEPDPATITLTGSDACDGYLELSWPPIISLGFETYEVEWTFIEQSLIDVSNPSVHIIPVQFKGNSTRVEVRGNTYRIPDIYPEGIVVARIRGVTEDFHYDTRLYKTDWSLPDAFALYHSTSSGVFEVNGSTPMASVEVISGFAEDQNWEFNMSFAEEGKRKQVISYYDGSLRNRQTTTSNNSENVPIVGEVIYDHLGRPAVNPLPVPVLDGNGLCFRALMNISKETGEPYNWEDFDPDNGDCGPTKTGRMDTLYGAERYYSRAGSYDVYTSGSPYTFTTNQKNGAAFIPVSEGYPFTQVEYMPDGTGRVRRQGGVGPTHQLNGVNDDDDPLPGKEIQYFYGYATDRELLRLFGNEVGLEQRYKKHYVVDQNGQRSVSYLDPSERTVATALVGDPEEAGNVLPLPGAAEANAPMEVILDNTSIRYEDGELIAVFQHIVSAAGNYEFTYTMTAPQLEAFCDNALCFDCIYDFEMSILDECGEELIPGGPKTATVGTVNYECGSEIQFTMTPDPLVLELDPGQIFIEKRLKINEAAYKQYEAKFIEQIDDCIPSIEELYTEERAKLSDDCEYDHCDDCIGDAAEKLTNGDITQLEYDFAVLHCKEICEPTPCTILLRNMIQDLSPGGQYFDNLGAYDPGVTDPDDQTANYGWLDAKLTLSEHNAFFSTINSTFTKSYTSWDQIRNEFKDEYAYLLINEHPEFCHYEACLVVEETYEYDYLMLGSDNAKEARLDGYFNPIGNSPTPIDFPAPAVKDPFFVNSSGTPIWYYYEMSDGLLNWPPTVPPASPISLWQILESYRTDPALQNMAGATLCPSELDFQLFYAGYQTKKAPLLTHYYDSVCPALDPEEMEGKTQRFIYNQSEVLNDLDPYPSGGDWGELKTNIMAEIAEDCANSCEGYAMAWAQSLAPCGFSPTEMDMLLAELKEICQNSCDEANPVGLSTTNVPTLNNNHTFEEALDWIMTLTSKSYTEQCNKDMFTFPNTSVLNVNSSMLSQPLDECACEKIEETATEYQDKLSGGTLPSGICSEADYFEYLHGFSINLDVAKCACAYLNDPDDMPEECEDYVILFGDRACRQEEKQRIREIEMILNAMIDDPGVNWLSSPIPAGYDLLSLFPDYLDENWAIYNQSEHPSCTTLKYEAEVVSVEISPGVFADQLEINISNSCYPGCTIYFMFDNPADAFPFTDIDDLIFESYALDAGQLLVKVINPGTSLPVYLRMSSSCALCNTDEVAFPDLSIPHTFGCIECVDCADIGLLWGAFEEKHAMLTFDKNEFAHVGIFHNYLKNTEKLNLPIQQLHSLLINCADLNACNPKSVSHLLVSLFQALLDNSDINDATTQLDNSTYGPVYAALFPGGFAGCNPRVERISATEYHLVSDCGDNCVYTLSGPIFGAMELDAHQAYSNPSYANMLKVATDAGHTSFIDITSTCLIFANCDPDLVLEICPPEPEEALDPCVLINDELASTNAYRRYNQLKEEAINDFRLRYYEKCMDAFEELGMKYNLKEYHYTLYYYDQAGNLIKTVPPSGVNPITSSSTLNQAETYLHTQTGSRVIPAHTLITRYKYNTINQVIEQETPDGGITRFWYDYLGRMVLAQNPRQNPDLFYSYTEFDALGRVVESGEITLPSGISPSESADPGFLAALLTTQQTTKTQITRSFYDEILIPFGTIPNFTQANLANRVSSTTRQDVFSSDPLEYAHATHYSYGIHGNVVKLITDRPSMEFYDGRYKSLEYRYDLISGNTHLVMYQAGELDQWYHYYRYDGDNRLTTVYTTNEFNPDLLRGFTLPNLSENPYWYNDVEYEFYPHGPLMRMNYGRPVVQGVDYSHTLHGWLKSVNATALSPGKDMGKDGHSSGLNTTIPFDIFAMQLHYYQEDYEYADLHTTAAVSNPIATQNVSSHIATNTHDLYNGNISQMHVSIPDPLSLGTGTFVNATLGKTYRYDQLNRIIGSLNHDDFNLGSFTWGVSAGAVSEQYKTDYTYDANGNILTLFRNGVDGNLPMDDLEYHYVANTNQLEYVTEQQTDDYNYPEDLEDQSAGNYTYDEVGNLVADQAEEIESIEWNVMGKIQLITRSVSSSKPDLEFIYDEKGQRIEKIEYLKATDGRIVNRSIYALDPNGSPMTVYTLHTWLEDDVYYDTLYLTENTIYGSARIGVVNMTRSLAHRQYELDGEDVINEVIVIHSLDGSPGSYTTTEKKYVIENNRAYRGRKRYEINNHLGNVSAVVSDKRTSIPDVSDDNLVDHYEAEIAALYDYYPFGSLMPERFYLNNGCTRVAQPPVDIVLEDDDLDDRLSNPPAVGTWYSSSEANIHASFNEDCQCFEVNANGTSGYVYMTVVPASGKRNQVTVRVKPVNMSKAVFQLVDVTNNRVLASRTAELWDAGMDFTAELEYNPPAGVSPTLELRIYPTASSGYSEMYIREVGWHNMNNASFTNTLTHTYTGTVSGWAGVPGVTVTNGLGNNVVKMTSTGALSGQVTVGVTAGELNVIRMDLNLFMEPSVKIEILDATTAQILYLEKTENKGLGVHTLDFGIYPANANVIVKVHFPGATGLAGIEIDNLKVENPTPGKTNKYNETFASATVGAWTGTGTLSYNGPCGCLQTQTTAKGHYAEVQVSGLTGNREHYLGMDLYTDMHNVIQVDVYEVATGHIVSSRIFSGNNKAHRLAMTFNAAGAVKIRATRLSATGTVNFRIDNVQVGDHGHTLASSGGLDMVNTVDFSEWSATGGTADFKVFLHGDQQMEIRDHSASYVSRDFTTTPGAVHELTFDIDRRGVVSGSVAVVVINPVTNGTITSQMVGSAGVTAVNLSFTPPGTSVELRLYSLNEYTLIDDIHLHWERVVYHTLCDNSKDYRYGFNGMEKDNERSGLGNGYTTEFRQYDSRLGRWFSTDPMAHERSWVSPYNFVQNNPLSRIDPKGNLDWHPDGRGNLVADKNDDAESLSNYLFTSWNTAYSILVDHYGYSVNSKGILNLKEGAVLKGLSRTLGGYKLTLLGGGANGYTNYSGYFAGAAFGDDFMHFGVNVQGFAYQRTNHGKHGKYMFGREHNAFLFRATLGQQIGNNMLGFRTGLELTVFDGRAALFGGLYTGFKGKYGFQAGGGLVGAVFRGEVTGQANVLGTKVTGKLGATVLSLGADGSFGMHWDNNAGTLNARITGEIAIGAGLRGDLEVELPIRSWYQAMPKPMTPFLPVGTFSF